MVAYTVNTRQVRDRYTVKAQIFSKIEADIENLHVSLLLDKPVSQLCFRKMTSAYDSELYLIEHPAIVVNLDNALNALGGEEAITEVHLIYSL